MSLAETPIDCVHQRLKRKLDDYGPTYDGDDDGVDLSLGLASFRMRKDEPNAAVNSFSTNQITPSPQHNHLHQPQQQQQKQPQSQAKPWVSRWPSCSSSSSPARFQPMHSVSKLQFFVRMMSGGKTLVLNANPEDTVESIHQRIHAITGIPVIHQRLIYMGKQLQWEKSLAECSIRNDAGLQLVGRMRSTPYPKAWQLMGEVVSLIFRLCKGGEFTRSSLEERELVKAMLVYFVDELLKDKNTKAINKDVAGHLQVFSSSCVPAALVMLYMSPHKANKKCADESIRLFVNWSMDVTLKLVQSACAPIMLEFCKLLGHDDPLYRLCRTSLGSMLECVPIQRGSKNSGRNEEPSIGVEDILLFVRELADRLSHDLTSNVLWPTSTGPSSSDVSDFMAFLLPLRTSIEVQVGLRGPILMPIREGDFNLSGYAEEITSLHNIFTKLVGNMEQCLQKLEECLAVKEIREGEHLRRGSCQYLAILKELNSLCKLYYGAEDQFGMILRQTKVSVSYLITRYANRSDDHRWILEHKGATDFESRRHLAMMLLAEVKDDYEELHEMLIDRSQILAESFEYFRQAEPDALRGGLLMEFKNEVATGPGVLREWFFLVCQAIFNPQNALFVACPNDRRRFFPNPASKVDPLHIEYFRFAGGVIALALMHKVQVGIVFDRVFFLQLAGKGVSLEDIHDADPCLYSSCKKILEMDAEIVDSDALGLTFVREVEELGSRTIVELCPGGKNISVNSWNRENYVNYLVQHRFVTSTKDQVTSFAQGFANILGNSRPHQLFFKSLELEDLDWMLYGSENAISVEDWKAHTEYNGYKGTDPQIRWFWKIVERMSAEQRKALLFFWTSVKYLPVEGFGGLASALYIYKSSESCDHLPSSHTCFYRLCFPPYPSMATMQDRLRIITQEHVGSSFGTW